MKLMNILFSCVLLSVMTACNNEQAATASQEITATNTLTNAPEIVGTWTYESFDFDFKTNIDFPGIDVLIKKQLEPIIEQNLSGTVVTYKADGTFDVNGKDKQAKGTYKFENNELIHEGFTDASSAINYASASINGDVLTLNVSADQFWKMLASTNIDENGLKQVKETLTINKLTYTFKKQ